MDYRGYDLTPRSIVGGVNISKGGEFIDFVFGGFIEARYAVDEIIREAEAEGSVEPKSLWAVICFDKFGLTVEGADSDPEALAAKWAPAAGQEFTHPTLEKPSIYMLIGPEDLAAAQQQEAETAVEDRTPLAGGFEY